jgi:hypothetical protein
MPSGLAISQPMFRSVVLAVLENNIKRAIWLGHEINPTARITLSNSETPSQPTALDLFPFFVCRRHDELHRIT